ncbi:trypco2 family protein [Streptomyces sp. NK08204]|uniref:trypco2 family protein n=1 Tax=Streptomyces sp. NK08204 TaxID=2873260 RepID=UPI001CEDAAD9|nr:trypco2 family protein [Streptomyces sp. NK08204]
MDIPLVDAVAAVRDELLAAAARGVDQEIQFAVGPVEMEFQVELRADVKATGGFRLWAVSAGTEAGVSQGRTHRVTFTLTPKSASGEDLLIKGSTERADGPGRTTRHVPH